MTSDGTKACARPPVGWTCSRGLDHDGPCAARPDDGTTPCYRCAGTGRLPAATAQLWDDAPMTVYDRWETIRDLMEPPKIGTIALDVGTGKRIRWDGQGWVEMSDD